MNPEAWKLLREIFDRHRDLRTFLDSAGFHAVKGTEAREFTEEVGDLFLRASPELLRALRNDDPGEMAS